MRAVDFRPVVWDAILSVGPGELVFGLARPVPDGLDVLDHRVVDKACFGDGERQALLRWVCDERATLVELHAHRPGVPACMSAIDLRGLADWVPHVRWRLGGRPYAALVRAGATIDGLAWTSADGRAEEVDDVVAGSTRMRTTGRSIQLLQGGFRDGRG